MEKEKVLKTIEWLEFIVNFDASKYEFKVDCIKSKFWNKNYKCPKCKMKFRRSAPVELKKHLVQEHKIMFPKLDLDILKEILRRLKNAMG